MIHLQDVTKIYKSDARITALDGVSLHVERGEFVAVAGRSGSGKSTLLNIIGALTRPTAGEVTVNGVNLKTAGEKTRAAFRNKSVGFVFQSFHVLGDRSVLENVMLPARFAPSPVPRAGDRAMECIRKVGLSDRSGTACSYLSGGQLQRVAIARALLMNPPLLLADEPTGNLDIETGNEILKLFYDLHREQNLTLVIVTHEERVACAAERELKLEDGKLKGSNRK